MRHALQPLAPHAFDHAAFAAALVDPALPAPQGLAAQDGAARDERFAVYRNNVVQGLVAALELRFGAVRRSVGEDFFAEMARLYATQNPPATPIMATYGDSYPDFVETFAPCADIPYLADLARIEAACTHAYHAQDAVPLKAEAFEQIAPDALASMRLRLHPSLFVLASDHPIATIFAMNRGEVPLEPIADWCPQDVCVVRPEMIVHVHHLPAGGAAFLDELGAGATLREAAERALAAAPSFDLAANLAAIIHCGLAVEIITPSFAPHA